MLVDGRTIGWVWPNFSLWELRSDRNDATPDHYACLVEPDFLDALQRLRTAFDRPLTVSSYYRSPEYDARVGGKGPHRTGRAIDLSVHGEAAYHLVGQAIRQGFTGIGINQRGPYEKRFVHVDSLPDAQGQPRPWVWTYG